MQIDKLYLLLALFVDEVLSTSYMSVRMNNCTFISVISLNHFIVIMDKKKVLFEHIMSFCSNFRIWLFRFGKCRRARCNIQRRVRRIFFLYSRSKKSCSFLHSKKWMNCWTYSMKNHIDRMRIRTHTTLSFRCTGIDTLYLFVVKLHCHNQF